jgi:acyl-coenzyme A thioesterase PaaI-like protein
MAWDKDITESVWRPGDELPLHNDACMVCGGESSFSPLATPFRVIEDGIVGTGVCFDHRHQGAPSYAHGGAVAAVLDDACGYVSFLVTRIFVTAHLEVDYRRPVLLDRDYDVRAECLGLEGRKVQLAASLLDGDEAIATARGLFIVVDIDHFRP